MLSEEGGPLPSGGQPKEQSVVGRVFRGTRVHTVALL